LIPTIAEGLGVREGAGMSIGLSLAHALADAHLLLVLDNFEQLTEAAPALADLLVGARQVRMLVTSRSVLNISGEQVVDVPPLQEPVELFVDRVRSLDATSTPTADDLDAFAELGRRLDALPLAIELASAQLRILRPRQLLQRLGNRPVAHLAGGSRDLPSRQHTLHDTIAWSYDLLSSDAKRLFERLSVFVGGAAVDAIERVTGPDGEPDVLAQLGTLVDHSLVRAIRQAPEPRYGMLQTIREFAVGRLEASGEQSATRARHTAYFRAMAAEGAIGIGRSTQLEWIDRFALEADNFRAVLRRAIRAGDATTAARIGADLSAYWQMRSLFTEGRGWMRAVEEMPTATPHDRAVAWTAGGMLAFWQGDIDAIETGVDEAITTLRDAGDAHALGFAELLRAVMLGATDVEGASAALADSSAQLDTEDEPFLRAVGLLARAYVARLAGDMVTASELARIAAEVSAETREYYIRGVASTLLASAALDLGDLPACRAHAIDALLASQKLRNLASAAYALELWSAAELRDGRIERAGRLYALAVKAWGMASAQPWRSERHLHREIIEGLERALGGELPRYVEAARELDLDDAVTELATTQPE
jgi:predicted ATPase